MDEIDLDWVIFVKLDENDGMGQKLYQNLILINLLWWATWVISEGKVTRQYTLMELLIIESFIYLKLQKNWSMKVYKSLVKNRKERDDCVKMSKIKFGFF